jgi:hypothetical protein
MFLGGSYHDRDNPHSNQASHGESIVWKTSEYSQKKCRQQSSSRRGLQSSGDDEDDDDDDDDDDAKYFLRRNWYKMYRESKIVTRNPKQPTKPHTATTKIREIDDGDANNDGNKEDDNDINEPMY